jgi:hypothetical protein
MYKYIILLSFLCSCGPPVDFTTKHGVDIYRGELKEITIILMENSLDFYINRLPELTPNITEAQIRFALKNSRIEWYNAPIPCYASEKGCAGLQQYKLIMVEWKLALYKSAFFHEIHHMMDELLWDNFDYVHENSWWSLIPQLNEEFKVFEFNL